VTSFPSGGLGFGLVTLVLVVGIWYCLYITTMPPLVAGPPCPLVYASVITHGRMQRRTSSQNHVWRYRMWTTLLCRPLWGV